MFRYVRRECVELKMVCPEPRINEKYADFVSLSSRMQGVERALKPLRAPLEAIGDVFLRHMATGQNPGWPSEHPQWVVHLSQNGTIGFEPWPSVLQSLHICAPSTSEWQRGPVVSGFRVSEKALVHPL